jgi:hypothetical protein
MGASNMGIAFDVQRVLFLPSAATFGSYGRYEQSVYIGNSRI